MIGLPWQRSIPLYVDTKQGLDAAKLQMVKAINGQINQGTTIDYLYTTQPSTVQTNYILDYPGSDLDLHIYDSEGHHVGINYGTGKTEIGIQGATYSGPDSIPEYISILHSGDKTYTAKIVAIETTENESYSLITIESPKLPPILSISPSNITISGSPGEKVNATLTLREYGCFSDLNEIGISSSDLTNDVEIDVPSSNVAFRIPSTTIPAGSGITVNLTIDIPKIAEPGKTYLGSIKAIDTSGATDNASFCLTISTPKTIFVDSNFTDNSVSHEWNTITKAILDANNGDTIFVYTGTYRENIILNNKNATIIDGGVSGKCIHVTADSVIISGFTIQNGTDGVYLDSSDECNIEGNIIADNGNGISIYNSHNNRIYHNNLIDSGNQAYDNTDTNQWDNGYPSGGNYWSDYTGYDHYSGPNQDIRGSDGIIDTPYSINAGAQDKYPFMLTDIIAPEVIGNTPSGSNVPVNTPITITFSETMEHESVESAFSTSPSTVGRYSWSGNTMTYTPNSNLEINTMYTVTVGTDAKDLAGNNLQSPYSWQFTTTSLEPSDSIYNGDFEIIEPTDSSNPDGWTVELGGRDQPGFGLYNDVSSDAYYSGEHSVHIRLIGYSNQYCYGIIKSPLINTVQGDLVWYQSQKTDFDASDIEYTIRFYDENDNLVSSNLYYTDTTTSQAGPGCGGGQGDTDMSPPAVIADNGGPACGGGDWYKFSSGIPEIDTDKFRFEIHIYQWEAPSKSGDGDACGSVCYVGFDNFWIVSKSAGEVLFADDFDTYATGSFPSSGAWNLKYNGMGDSYQIVDSSQSVSSPNSLKLEGEANWAASADHPLAETPDQVIYEVDVKVTQPGSSVMNYHDAAIGLANPNIGTWGTRYAGVIFGNAENRVIQPGNIPFNFEQWYHIKVEADMINGVYDVWLDDQLIASDISTSSNGDYTDIRLEGGNNAHTRVWFDNVKVLSS
jgi:parallel beta-helix repeat protein